MLSSPAWDLHDEAVMFAERLRKLRTERGLTQTRLAELLHTSPRVYNRWETGAATPQFDTLVQIADILQVSLDELAGRKEPSDKAIIHNPKLHELYQRVDDLTDEDQQALVVLLDSLVKRSQMQKVMSA